MLRKRNKKQDDFFRQKSEIIYDILVDFGCRLGVGWASVGAGENGAFDCPGRFWGAIAFWVAFLYLFVSILASFWFDFGVVFMVSGVNCKVF